MSQARARDLGTTIYLPEEFKCKLSENVDRKIISVFQEARKCTRCYGTVPLHVPLPDEKNGGINAKVLFLVERPGRVGTGKSGRVSFENRDPTAYFFKELFLSTGISRKEIFITNAVLCHPLIEEYRDALPSAREIKNCIYFLKKQIEYVNPVLIVTLGTRAL